ncbi:MAG: hypothetical protein AAFR17_00255 [Pseudomonadota bacterium]
MADSQSPLFIAAGAGALGLLIGYAAGAGGDDDARKMTASLTSVEESMAASSAEMGAKLDSLSGELGEALALAGEQRGILGEGQVAIDVKVSELNARMDAIEDMVDGLAQAGLSKDDLAEAVAAGYAARHAAHQAKKAAAAATAQDAPAPESAAPESVAAEAEATAPSTAPEDPKLATLADAVGEDGMALSPGQTAIVGEGRFFISQVTDDFVRGLVVGGEKVELSIFGGQVELGGCTLLLKGVADGTAYLKPEC